MKTVAVAASLGLLLVTGLMAQQPPFKRTLLQQVDSAPGREVVTARVDIPGGIAVGRHTHFGEEIGYVLEGTLTLEIDGTTKVVKAGEAFFVPTGKPHNATNTATGAATVIANYTVEKGKPLATPAK